MGITTLLSIVIFAIPSGIELSSVVACLYLGSAQERNVHFTRKTSDSSASASEKVIFKDLGIQSARSENIDNCSPNAHGCDSNSLKSFSVLARIENTSLFSRELSWRLRSSDNESSSVDDSVSDSWGDSSCSRTDRKHFHIPLTFPCFHGTETRLFCCT